MDGTHLSIDGLRAIHWVHRVGAVFAVSVLFYLGLKTLRAAIVSANPELRRWAFTLLSLCIIQLITGMSNIILDWPLIAALLHTGGAAAILVVLIRMLTLSAEEFDRV